MQYVDAQYHWNRQTKFAHHKCRKQNRSEHGQENQFEVCFSLIVFMCGEKKLACLPQT